ncbi:hypothetical protein LQ327_30630 [Actinomycetospora endophytica]|uniref:PI-PLC Y-box domain-containing protein n=1 Tax=Actinomycetospora endophytica TaxID=2291215 RepID=A0ABS8PJQ1_9PSEU|nr:hypothetical protein [Actinomycetospora endophytica]MCD2197735.1 hypothetical protein [Actinomycetospora endophytica]
MTALLDRLRDGGPAGSTSPGGPPPIAAVRRRRWAVAVGVLALVVAIPVVISSWPVSPATTLSPAQLRDRVTASSDVPWSGYAEASGGLNLPDVSQFSDVTTLLSGTSRLRVWYAAPDESRVDQLYPTGERSRYTTPNGQAVWDYGAQLLTLVRRDPVVRLPRPDDLPPPELARRLLSGTAPDDAVSPLPARRLAGVDAAGFRVTVADPRTTVGAVDVWADPVSGLPVGVEVRTKDTAGRLADGPVVVSTMLDLDQSSPDPAVLQPHAGPGAGTTRSPTSDLFGILGRGSPAAVPGRVDGVDREPPERRFSAIGKYGTSLSQLVVVPLPSDLATSLLSNISRGGSAARTIAVDQQPTARGQTASTQAGALSSSLLQLAVVRVGDRAWAIGGLVPDAVLDRAVSDVAGSAT